MASLPSQLLPSPFRISSFDSIPHNPLLPSISTANFHHRSFIVTSYKPKGGIVTDDQKREFIDRYGLNPDEFLPKSSQKIRKRRGQGKQVSVEEQESGILTDVKKREFIERYGINPDDFSPKPEKIRKRRGQGKQAFMQELERGPPKETHRLLQVLGGTARRKKLLSPKSMDVRPMMEVVKGAAFSILQAAGGSPQSLIPGRWLDLYSGTGSVGIEAISRGCSEVHFVEMDPWVISDVLRPNLDSTGFLDMSVIHPVRVEYFLENAERFVGKDGGFDYISVTPPYELVDYAVLMEQVANSSIVGENTFVLVEYPSRTEMLDSCGCLPKIADRRFGRTLLAIYGPKWAQKKSK